ncbi:hypothetical protein [Bradyrhizobium liaoningense]|uniref:hypothetical protein n=1 Tax=Bradyrhizobium liaoningense TaxID=43992 RepID=UPI001BA45DA2|nr:hypothetical protein [Bradyrhizobium liaoningense]MBR0712805.1 hypothetical protein [Bradyrhizobium liaoningense]
MSGGWGRPFDEPIDASGHKLVTLRDAGEYIAALPKAVHDRPEWQAAMEALILVVELGGPTMFARIGIMRALNHGKSPPNAEPRRKKAKAYWVIR